MNITVWKTGDIYFASLDEFDTIDPYEDKVDVSGTDIMELMKELGKAIRKEIEFQTEK